VCIPRRSSFESHNSFYCSVRLSAICLFSETQIPFFLTSATPSCPFVPVPRCLSPHVVLFIIRTPGMIFSFENPWQRCFRCTPRLSRCVIPSLFFLSFPTTQTPRAEVGLYGPGSFFSPFSSPLGAPFSPFPVFLSSRFFIILLRPGKMRFGCPPGPCVSPLSCYWASLPFPRIWSFTKIFLFCGQKPSSLPKCIAPGFLHLVPFFRQYQQSFFVVPLPSKVLPVGWQPV